MNLFKRAVTLEVANEIRAEKIELKKEYQASQTDVEFREEVIEELVNVFGFARHVAAEQTDTQAKLMTKAREIKFI